MQATRTALTLLASFGLALVACEKSESHSDHAVDTGTHTHADGSTHGGHSEPAADSAPTQEDHPHDETALTPATIGDITVELAQGHGVVEAGKESHLVVKLPYSDNGATVVRAWIGSDDRTLSLVGRGEYAPAHDDYDVHATAPDPLPENAMWWIEIERPDGTKLTGSTKPITE